MNKINLNKESYKASPSTLCKGCGHDSITLNLINALYELCIDPAQVIKLSGIGCSSKIPNYFLKSSFGFNSLHGRMAALATGVNLSQPKAKLIGISGDGDTASIGLGGFLHLIRKNVPIVYIVANNGVYGLTKGQFSATSHKNDISKLNLEQNLPELDILLQALSTGCSFVARSFSGENKQLKNILKLALNHNGTAVIDVISPCIVYGNHKDFSKSYTYTQETNHPLHEIDIINDDILILKDSLKYKLIPLKEQNHDTSSLPQALKLILKEKTDNILHTGLIYIDKSKPNLNQAYGFSNKDKFCLKEEDLRLSKENFNTFNNGALI